MTLWCVAVPQSICTGNIWELRRDDEKVSNRTGRSHDETYPGTGGRYGQDTAAVSGSLCGRSQGSLLGGGRRKLVSVLHFGVVDFVKEVDTEGSRRRMPQNAPSHSRDSNTFGPVS